MIRWMTVFLHNRGYSVSDYNTYPVTVGCAEILLIFVAAVLVDKLGNPQIIIFLFGTIQIYGYAVFAAFPIVYFRYGYFGLGES
ncbi:uncharacterized protein K489DRAFT_167487 [Dissoconium aciculare CBS 342.82]|uniref:Uncharacterized protein n=1 Tax=Dissoconium aciculare CBS 342.82 TaxID=1314786 RepID=A0A6J3MCJ8_9PEZI|nr:uncharacterized protein K489DRAFT_167487 [Dissoconium aciculare CBS 342.82]KAF1825745.1 hypothetical protein K489DRAFT_167487 [Dissoconium aciculare CBS 342.82]